MLEEVKKIELSVTYYNELVKEFRKVLKNLNFSDIDINWYIIFATTYGASLSKDISIENKIKDTKDLLGLFDERSPLYTKVLTDAQIEKRILDLESDLAYLEYCVQNNIIGNYQDKIFRTKDIINNLILNLIRNTLGSYYELLFPLLPKYELNDGGYWNVDEILNFLLKYEEIKMKENKSLERSLK